ncbi:hypothetical protein [Sphingomonas sp. 28-62-11]|uniref:hypothetical protein n=1 Tax=Sphingomonas sp. 28-62-11 TaxID=1970432 RepID=UPI0035A87147
MRNHRAPGGARRACRDGAIMVRLAATDEGVGAMTMGSKQGKLAVMVAAMSTVLGGCTTSGSAISVRPDTTPVPTTTRGGAGLDRVLGREANALVALFGQPDADIREGNARKLQFASAACVLDAYLYPRGNAAPVVTHVDSRQPDGSPIDRASCIAALTRRDGGK